MGEQKLRVDTQHLQAQAESLSVKLHKIGTELDAVAETMEETQKYWSGSGAGSFRTAYQKCQTNAQEEMGRIHHNPELLKSMAQTYEQTEVAAQSLGRELPKSLFW